MIDVTNLRSGTTFQLDGIPYLVLKYTHTKMGRGTANVRLQARNLKTGAIEEKTFMSGGRVEEAPTFKRQMQYLYSARKQGTSSAYSDSDVAVFMDPTNFEQIEIPQRIIKEQIRFLKDGEMVDILFWNQIPLSIELPPKVKLLVRETGPGVKGNSATNIWKPATLENGLVVKVPLFVEVGDKIVVDTRTGEYVERAKE